MAADVSVPDDSLALDALETALVEGDPCRAGELLREARRWYREAAPSAGNTADARIRTARECDFCARPFDRQLDLVGICAGHPPTFAVVSPTQWIEGSWSAVTGRRERPSIVSCNFCLMAWHERVEERTDVRDAKTLWPRGDELLAEVERAIGVTHRAIMTGLAARSARSGINESVVAGCSTCNRTEVVVVRGRSGDVCTRCLHAAWTWRGEQRNDSWRDDA